MKRALLSMIFVLAAVVGWSQDIMGKWVTGDKVNGKIVWLKQGPETKDKHNPDAKLQERKLMGVHILSGLSKKKDKWEGGKIYNPKNGKTYKCAIWLDGQNLKVRGYLGPFYETQVWKRAK